MNKATKPSRQMAFQLSGLEFQEALKLFKTLGSSVVIDAYLKAIPDEQKRNRLSGALQVAIQCSAMKTDPSRVRKIVCWRDDQGKPGMLNTEIAKEEVVAP